VTQFLPDAPARLDLGARRLGVILAHGDQAEVVQR
jgi:hypothetical protein